MSPKKSATAETVAPPPSLVDVGTKLGNGFLRVLKTSTPLVEVETPDPAASQRILIDTALAFAAHYNEDEPAFLQWDVVRGLRAVPAKPVAPKQAYPGSLALAAALKAAQRDQSATIGDPITALDVCAHLPEGSVVFILNAHRFLGDTPMMQAVWNLRDEYKQEGHARTLVLLGAAFITPIELQGDVIQLVEELPNRVQLATLVRDQYNNADPPLPAPSESVVQHAVDALIGLSMFTAEQVTAMALTPDGLDMEVLWEHKVNAIKKTPGLSVFRGDANHGLHLVKGADNVRDYFQALIDADTFGVIGFVDEGEKGLAGGTADFSGDSGVAKDQLGTFLTFANDKTDFGILLAGISGTGKTFVARCAAATSGKPMVTIDFGAMKSSNVGESEGRLRTAFKVLEAMAGGPGRILLVMTANKTTDFPPELNRRFPDQFFFDTPDDEARRALWPVYITRDGLTPEQAAIPPGWDEGWTGDEIQRACFKAKKLKITVQQASRYIIPSAKAHEKKHQALREAAHGSFLSASTPGWYRAPSKAPTVNEDAYLQALAVGGTRKVRLDKKDMN